MVFFCLGDCGGFWDAVEEVSVLMNGDVEKEKLKKEKKIILWGSILSSFWDPGCKNMALRRSCMEVNLTYTISVNKWKKKKANRT